MSDKPPPVQEAQIVTDESTPPPPTSGFDINAYNATLEIVRRRLGILDKTKVQLKKLKEMYNDVFVNDSTYNAADKIVKDAMKKRKDVQAQLAKQPAVVETSGKIKDLKEQIKDNEEQLSLELMEYYKTSGVTEIEDEEGNVQEFTIVIRLKGKKKAEK